MKKILKVFPVVAALLLLVGVFLSPPISAATDNVEKYVSTAGNVTIAGESVYHKELSNGDFIAAGRTVVSDGPVLDNLYAFGEKVEINGGVGNDAVVMGGIVVINGPIGGDLRVFGDRVFINSEHVNGDVIVAAQEVDIYSKKIEGDLKIYAGSVFLNKYLEVVGTVNAKNENNSNLNNITVDDERIISIKDPKIVGYPNYYYFNNQDVSSPFSWVFELFCGSFVLLGSVLVAFLIFKFFPVFSESAVKAMKSNVLKNAVIGFLVMFASIFVIILLAITIIGLPIAGMMLLLGLFAIILSGIYARYIIGDVVLKGVFKQTKPNVFWKLLIGYVLVSVIFYVLSEHLNLEVVKVLINFFFKCWGVGSLISLKYKAIRVK